MRHSRIMLAAALGIVPLLLAAVGWAEDRKETEAAAGHDVAAASHANLRVLAADIGRPQLGSLMRGYKRDLGVECSYCHVQDRDTGKLDYASDANPKKAIARVMIAMLDDINDKHLALLGEDVRYSTPVTCGTCHQGRANPPLWESKQ